MSCFLRRCPSAWAVLAVGVGWAAGLTACEEEHPPPPCFGICDAGPPCDETYDPRIDPIVRGHFHD